MSNIKIIKLSDQGFCFGVKRAIKIAEETSKNDTLPRPIYLLGNIVHNEHISTYLKSLDIIVIEGSNRLEMLDMVPNNKTVIFSAHGVSQKVREKAIKKNLTIIDATCPYVEKTFKLVEEKANDNASILYIGKRDHPETEAVLELDKHIHLVENDNLMFDNLNTEKIYVAHQTTMSNYDIENLFEKIKTVYPNALKLDMICRVTENRQKQLSEIGNLHLEGASLIIVIGDKHSNNSTKLYELAKRNASVDAVFIESISELNLEMVKKYQNVVIASGTSTPPSLIKEVIDTINIIDTITSSHVDSNIQLNKLLEE